MAKVVTITNPVTGQPAQVDQLDHTAQQIDDAVEAARWSHRNLLDNAYFANPDAIIDQRGGYVVPPGAPYYSDTGLSTQVGTVSAYTKAVKVNDTYGTITVSGTTYYVAWSAAVRGYTGAGYGIDRWFAVSPGTVVTVQSGYVRIAPPAGNYFGWANYFEADSLLGQTVTFSALCRYTGSGGAILPYITAYIGDNQYDGSAQINQTTWQCISFTITFPTDKPSDGRFGFDVVAMQNFGVDIKAAKLELGTVQTLAHQDENGNWVLNDPPPDPAVELLMCQRYYQIFATQSMRPTDKDDFRPPMRVTPALGTININGKTYYTADANL